MEGSTRRVRCEPISLFPAPSTVHWLLTEGAPLKEISTPANKPLFLLSKLSPAAAPELRTIDSAGSRRCGWRELRQQEQGFVRRCGYFLQRCALGEQSVDRGRRGEQ